MVRLVVMVMVVILIMMTPVHAIAAHYDIINSYVSVLRPSATFSGKKRKSSIYFIRFHLLYFIQKSFKNVYFMEYQR